ncbi:ubiquitin-protein ligase (E3) [Exophiala xenobiotica]|nr:ubiquitin-protein ligase (E3) [Exophiala xenobiotica]
MGEREAKEDREIMRLYRERGESNISGVAGSARKARQVNLSGRGAPNPWAALAKPGQSSASSTVAQAQADRLKRQQERDRLTATKRIQSVWRGHSARRKQKAYWRYMWDENEAQRCGSSQRLDYRRLIDAVDDITRYRDSAQLLHQTRLLLRFQEFRRNGVRDETDTLRLIYFGEALRQTVPPSAQSDLDDIWRSTLLRLGNIVARHLKCVLRHESEQTRASHGSRLLDMITLLCGLVPDEMTSNSETFFDAIEAVLISQRGTVSRQCAGAIVALLTSSGSHKRTVYLAFATRVLGQDAFAADKSLLDHLAMALDFDELALAMSTEVEDLTAGTKETNITQLLWQLAHLIYIHDSLQTGDASQNTYIEAVSALLGQGANEVAQSLDLADQPVFGHGSSTPKPFPPFVGEMISRLPRQDNVREVLKEMGANKQSQEGSDFDSAKRLANYAVALLRAFPSRAQNIRMSLYQGSVRSLEDTDMSTIQYFWQTARTTAVFKKATNNYRSILSLLREAAPETNQIGQAPVSKAEISLWRDEWRIILLLLELYTFVLKFMDDDDFFALDKSRTFGTSNTPSSIISRRGALPLEDVALMTTFLKNLAFTLYWNAADLVESNEVEEEANLSALFGGAAPPATRSTEKKQQTLTGNGVSQGYLKGLVTGLLRMLHERDSRRSFVPAGHWLMSDQINMSGFIPAVVAEEEKRHQLGDDDETEEQQDEIDKATELDMSAGSGASDALLSSMFGIRPSHMPRSMASRQADRLERQRQHARKKRQLESLAPRLEILRNLPFFIPFETRVQIFREFIHQDQVRRRDGAIDPDQWRMSVATLTQGRSADGRPRGLDIISRHHAEIHRESVFEDAYDAFFQLGEGLKEPIQITFIDKFGAPEAGIDGGGVTKEFLMSVTSEAFDPEASLSMFKENPQHSLYPNPLIYQETREYLKRVGRKPGTDGFDKPLTEFLRRFQFLGRVVGKCLYEGILIDVTFAGFFLLKWALTGGTTVGSNESAYHATINDVRDYDEELYQGLLKLKNYPGDVEVDFALDFTVTDTLNIMDEYGKETPHTITTELIPNGANTPVTNTNRPLYIDRIVRYKLQQQPKAVTDAFLQGLGQIVQPMWLAMFNQKELQKLVGGDNTELDIADLRRNTQYGGVYSIGDDGLEHPTVRLFWKALQEMGDDDRRKVLKFVTSTPRAPLLGFSHLNPKFSIRDSSDDQERLPSTSTCVNLLKLPRYGDIRTLKEKLLYAVNSGAGFDLS